jgi:hypothetical protein
MSADDAVDGSPTTVQRPWLVQLLARRTAKIAAVALANKMAWMIWGHHDKRRALQGATGRGSIVTSGERRSLSLGRADAM